MIRKEKEKRGQQEMGVWGQLYLAAYQKESRRSKEEEEGTREAICPVLTACWSHKLC